MSHPYKKTQIRQYRNQVEQAIHQSKETESQMAPHLRQDLVDYRKNTLRAEARSGTLAYAFLRGKTLRSTEDDLLESHPANIKIAKWSRPRWNDVWNLVIEFSYIGDDTELAGLGRAFERWFKAANLPKHVAPPLVYDLR